MTLSILPTPSIKSHQPLLATVSTSDKYIGRTLEFSSHFAWIWPIINGSQLAQHFSNLSDRQEGPKDLRN